MDERPPLLDQLTARAQTYLADLQQNAQMASKMFEEAQDDLGAAVVADCTALFLSLLQKLAADSGDAESARILGESLQSMLDGTPHEQRCGIGPRRPLRDPATGTETGWHYHVDYQTRITYLHDPGNSSVALGGISWTPSKLREVAAVRERLRAELAAGLCPEPSADDGDLTRWVSAAFELCPEHVLDKFITRADALRGDGHTGCAEKALACFAALPQVAGSPERSRRVADLLAACGARPILSPEPLRGVVPADPPPFCVEESGGYAAASWVWEKLHMLIGITNTMAAWMGHFRVASTQPRFGEDFELRIRGNAGGWSATLCRKEAAGGPSR